jgi:transposase
MSRRPKDPLRPLTADERACLEQLSRARSEPASHVARAKAVLAVAAGHSYQDAASAAGRRSGDAVAQLVARFNAEGLAALEPGHGGGPPVRYTPVERERILAEVRRPPDREQDGTATWSLTTLQRALRHAPDGLPTVSTYTIWRVLHDAGFRWQQSRTWCNTGTVLRQRKNGPVRVEDPDSTVKKT